MVAKIVSAEKQIGFSNSKDKDPAWRHFNYTMNDLENKIMVLIVMAATYQDFQLVLSRMKYHVLLLKKKSRNFFFAYRNSWGD